jgi:hypothetical protein
MKLLLEKYVAMWRWAIRAGGTSGADGLMLWMMVMGKREESQDLTMNWINRTCPLIRFRYWKQGLI